MFHVIIYFIFFSLLTCEGFLLKKQGKGRKAGSLGYLGRRIFEMSTFIALLDVLASICNRCDCISLRFPDVSQMLCWMPWPDDFAISKCFFSFLLLDDCYAWCLEWFCHLIVNLFPFFPSDYFARCLDAGSFWDLCLHGVSCCLGQIIWQRIYLHFFCLPANLLPSYLLLDACAVCTIALSLFVIGLLASLSYLSLIFAFCPMSWPDHFALGFRFFLPLRFLHGISCRVPWPISLYYDRNHNPLPADACASRFAILCLHICHPPTVCPQLPQRERKSMTFVILSSLGSMLG